jgi:type IX secretion system PorP/SprF family membrane protein
MFTQFYANPLYQAPSFAGAVKGYRASFNYRNQWPKMGGNLSSTTFSVDYNLSALNSGLGIMAIRDNAGSAPYSYTGVTFMYAYNVMINRRTYFRPGISFNYSQRNIDRDALRFASDYYVDLPPVDESQFRPSQDVDGCISALLLMKNFWFGAAVDHLIEPDVSTYGTSDRLPRKYSVFIGYKMYKMERLMGNKRQSLTFAANYKQQGVFKQFDLGIYWHYAPLVLGVWYRDLPFIDQYSKRDALALLVGYQLEDLNIGYSYDFTISKLVGSTNGAHEISVNYKFQIKQKKRFKPIPCPEF